MVDVLAEYGVMGVVVILFGGLISFLQKTLMGKMLEVEDICIKLIDRWNRSDESRDRRHEDLTKELGELSDKISYLNGKINGK
jgi:hypothetical protein